MKYEEAAKRWGEHRLRRAKVQFDEVTSVDFNVESYVPCPTCGTETEFGAVIWFLGMTEILQELFTITEE